jgi:hypothetical protein
LISELDLHPPPWPGGAGGVVDHVRKHPPQQQGIRLNGHIGPGQHYHRRSVLDLRHLRGLAGQQPQFKRADLRDGRCARELTRDEVEQPGHFPGQDLDSLPGTPGQAGLATYSFHQERQCRDLMPQVVQQAADGERIVTVERQKVGHGRAGGPHIKQATGREPSADGGDKADDPLGDAISRAQVQH